VFSIFNKRYDNIQISSKQEITAFTNRSTNIIKKRSSLIRAADPCATSDFTEEEKQ
jgi:hypothetical protein